MIQTLLMNTLETIPLQNLTITLIPVMAVLGIYYQWRLDTNKVIYAICRMVLQLLIVGYFLNSLFSNESVSTTLLILILMLFLSGWIALGTVNVKRQQLLTITLISLTIALILSLSVIVFGVLDLKPWYTPRYLIPLAGMILANSMNSISLAAERFESEYKQKQDYSQARNTAFNAALIPTVNSLFAVGIVSLPGMMTGQILSGVSPFIAARYQMMVMGMIFSSAGISTACFLILLKNKHYKRDIIKVNK